MGYSIHISTDREIALDDAEAIVADLPNELRSPVPGIGMSRTKWGWSAATDISLPEGAEWRISGSYSMSGTVARLMADALAMRLRMRGYRVRIGEMT